MVDSITIKAPAKVNLFLEVRGKREDGYHDLESVLQTISIHDELTISLSDSGRVSIECSAGELETGDNLAVRAAEVFREAADLDRGVEISLAKGIPVQAGLGGGSSDAAAVLSGLNVLTGGRLEADVLGALAARLGSDVPFFLEGATALVTGRGERVETIPARGKYHFVVFYPGFGLSTAEVYGNFELTGKTRDANLLCALLSQGNLETAREHFFNRLEETAFGLEGRLSDAKSVMRRCVGDVPITLCGSGASLFSAFLDADRARECCRVLREFGVGKVFVAESATGGRG